MTHTIDKPDNDTYFIVKDVADTNIHYGLNMTTQVTDTNTTLRPDLETFLVEQDWVNRLGELDITLPEDD